MLNFTDLALRRGPHLLIEHASIVIHRGNKVGLTGANGTGKSSLFALIRGELHPDAGEFSLPPGLTIAHVAQETPAADTPAIEYVMDGDEELRRLQQRIGQAEAANEGELQARLHARLEAIGGYTARPRAATLMHGLGFAPQEDEQPVTRLSGGWRMRLNLARALMCRSDLLLLDEPTNHLDLDAVIWLETWLAAYPGTLLLISHDRDFLDRITDHILHIEHGAMRLYSGNYSAFETQRAARLANQSAAWERQQREIRHVRAFVDRFRAKATRARQAQSRLKALARMEQIAPAHVDSPFHFSFRAPEKLPNPLLSLQSVSAGYGTQPVLRNIDLGLLASDRIGLLGHNGAGKSTLIRLLAGELAPQAGDRVPATGLRIGYFAQHQLEQLDAGASPLEHLRCLDGRAREQALRDYLGGFGFGGERAERPVAPFSGGEKARLVLALIVYRRPNLLLLDEPTNHLDIEMRHALTLALQDFEGAVVLVSHDRHLLRTVTDDLWLVHGGAVQPFRGDIDDYPGWLAEQRRTSRRRPTPAASGEHTAASRRDRRREAARQRGALQSLRRKSRRLEEEMARLATELSHLEERLSDPALYAPEARDTLLEQIEAQARLKRELAAAEEAWLAAGEALESAGP